MKIVTSEEFEQTLLRDCNECKHVDSQSDGGLVLSSWDGKIWRKIYYQKTSTGSLRHEMIDENLVDLYPFGHNNEKPMMVWEVSTSKIPTYSDYDYGQAIRMIFDLMRR